MNRKQIGGMILFGGIILLAIIGKITGGEGFFSEEWKLLFSGDVEGMINYIRSFGAYAMLVSFLAVVLVNTLGFLPNIFLLAANGVIFGVVKGTLISWVAESVGVIISFFVMRYLFRDYAHKILEKNNAMKRLDEYSGQHGFRMMLFARAIPYVPSGLITALGALSKISVREYVLATFLGKLPSAWVEVTMGHDLAAYREHSSRLAILLVGSAVAYYIFWRHRKKVQSRTSRETVTGGEESEEP